ncbi:MAG: hypothetical protein LUQ38_07840 [Methanotrichaceae archaeon]|nr:hypothetical protein [Methanotrichaceae archaeon]MDD1758601.1 hypothetical protein [Methanotrichaceae archaeon]
MVMYHLKDSSERLEFARLVERTAFASIDKMDLNRLFEENPIDIIDPFWIQASAWWEVDDQEKALVIFFRIWEQVIKTSKAQMLKLEYAKAALKEKKRIKIEDLRLTEGEEIRIAWKEYWEHDSKRFDGG